MKISASTKIRAVGGASVLALSAGLTGTALAQMAPSPVMAAPTPTAPMPPANAEECAIVDGTVTCAPGTDADGFVDLSDDPLGLDIQDGSVVQGPVVITGATTGSVDGSIQTTGDGDGGLAVGDASDVTIGGFVQTDGQFSVGVQTGANSTLTNDGTIYTTGDNFSDGVLLGAGSTFINTGLVQTDGDESFGVFSDASGVTVINEVTGSIFTSGTGSAGIGVLDNAVVTNDGLVQTFGDFSIGIDTQELATVVNTGNISTAGEESIGIAVRAESVVTNSGNVETAGDFASGIVGTGNVTVVNDGSVQTSGEEAAGILMLGGADVTNNGEITTTGDFGIGILTDVDAVVTNTGTISTAGEEAFGILTLGDNADITNAEGATITTSGLAGFGIVTLDNSIVVNNGTIETTGDFGIGIDTQEMATVSNAGTIQTTGLLGLGIGVRSDSSVTNSGTIMTAGDEANGITALNNAVIVNSGMISTAGEEAVGISALDNADITNSGSIATTGEEDAFAILVRDDATITNSGSITAAGDDSYAIEASDGLTLINSGTITSVDRAVNADDDVTITNQMGGLITTTGDNDTIQTGDNLTIINDGTISNSGFDTKIIDAGDNLTVTNNGTITSDWKGVEGEANFTLTNNAGALIFSTNDEAVEADDAGLTVVNDGEIISPKDDAVDGGADVTITNTGLIRGGENDGLELDSGTITNSGIIESLSSDPSGDFSDAGLTNRELDAGIDFDGVDDPANLAGPEFDTVTNLAGGIIRGDIGINASSGNFVSDGEGGSEAGSPANVREQVIVNFGEITGNLVNPVTGRIDAVLLGAGDDTFQQWTGAVVNGWIDLEGGDDTFILEGTASSISGRVEGGMGNDTAILAGTLDAEKFDGFEAFQLGSDLGGTLNDLTISGARTLDGDVVHVGEVTLGLGVDSLTATGSITLEETGVLNIETPLDSALIGQTVLVLQEGDGADFTDNGATINIIDDDLLIDYVPVAGSLSVQVNAVDPLVNAADGNVVAFGGALNAGLNGGSLSQANFDLVNGLPNTAAYETLALDALPSLSEGAAREIFESSSAASDALNRHLAGNSSGIWGEFIVRGAEQDGVSQSQGGYDSEQLIFTVGGDFVFGEMGRIGVLASYGDIENDDLGSNGGVRGQTEIESIKLGLYIATDFADERGFLNGELAYLTGEIEQNRGGVLGSINSAYDFDGFAYSATAGYDLLGDENVWLTPSVGINGASIEFDDAVEAGGFGFTVAREDADFLELRGAIELGAQVSEGVNGYVRGTVIEDLEDDQRSLVLTSSQLATFSVQTPLRETSRFELAAGANVDVTESFSVELGYLGDFADGYNAHSAHVTARIAF